MTVFLTPGKWSAAGPLVRFWAVRARGVRAGPGP